MKHSLILAIALAAASSVAAWANDFQTAIDRFARAEYMQNASVGVCVMDLASGDVLAITTASTMKTVTSASALALLGKDYQFPTIVYAIGEIKGSRLHGNVVVKGFGDPTLGSRYFPENANIVEQVQNALQEMGIKKIDGDIRYDESAYPFETFSDNWMIEDLAYSYGPGVHAINYCDNLVNLSFDRSGNEAAGNHQLRSDFARSRGRLPEHVSPDEHRS